MPDYTVQSHDGQRPWQGQKGHFIDHNLTVSVDEGDGKGRNLQVVVTQKPETHDPAPGDVIFGHLETQEIPKKDGSTFTKTKLKKDQRSDSGPQAISQTAGAATPRSADRAANFDERGARIERMAAWKVAAQICGCIQTVSLADNYQGDFLKVVDWLLADLDNASSTTPHTHISSPEGQTQGSVRQEKEPTPAPANAPLDTAESVQADRRGNLRFSDKPASTASKSFFTKLLREKQGSDALRTVFHEYATRNGVLTQQGLSLAIEALKEAPDATKAALALGLTPPSDVPFDDDGLPPASDEVEALAAGRYDDIPF